jgi:vacuolar-type H+-ATPase subunit E/Vma4
VSTTNETASTAKNQAGQVASTGQQEAGAVASTAAGAAQDVASTAADQAKTVVSEAATQARDLVGEARTQVRDQAGQQTQKAAQSVRSIADELEGMAQGQAPKGPAGDLVRQVASKGHDVAGYLENADPERLLEDVRGWARRKPGLFLLGAGLAGFAAARLAKGAKQGGDSQSQATSYEPYPATSAYGTTGYETGGYETGGYETGGYETGYETGTATTAGMGYAATDAGLGAPTYGGTAAGYPVSGVEEPGTATGYDTGSRERGDLA